MKLRITDGVSGAVENVTVDSFNMRVAKNTDGSTLFLVNATMSTVSSDSYEQNNNISRKYNVIPTITISE